MCREGIYIYPCTRLVHDSVVVSVYTNRWNRVTGARESRVVEEDSQDTKGKCILFKTERFIIFLQLISALRFVVTTLIHPSDYSLFFFNIIMEPATTEIRIS